MGGGADDAVCYPHRLASAAWLTQGPLGRLLAILDAEGEEARVVGGAVRNALLAEPIGDIDVATTATPEEVMRRAEAAGFKAVPTGLAHGTLTVVIESYPFEVTTLRTDVETFGRRATVAFGRDWRVDAERRDFTINALFVDAYGTLYDYVGGFPDLEVRRVRFIGDAATRIGEDYLRILRFFRFHAAYGEGTLDAAGLRACIAARNGLDQLSRERVRAELLKLLIARGAAPTLTEMADSGLLDQVLGGVPVLANFVAMTEQEVALRLPPDPVRRLGALAVLVTEDADRLWRKLRLTNAEHARLVKMAEEWWRIAPGGKETEFRALLYRLGPESFLDRVLQAWAHAHTPATDARWQHLADLPQRWNAPKFPLKAADFIAAGLDKGPELGVALRASEEAWISQGFPQEPDALARIVDRTIAVHRRH